jgi:hypothetical protein
MEGDYTRTKAKARERELRNRATRRRTFLTRTWRVSGRGNEFLNFHKINVKINVTIFPDSKRWRYKVGQQFSARGFATQDEAKLTAFDALQETLQQREERRRAALPWQV